MKFTADELRAITILEGLPDRQIAWFSDHGEKIDLAPGDRMFERGQPSDFMFIIVKGTIQRYEEIGGAVVARGHDPARRGNGGAALFAHDSVSGLHRGRRGLAGPPRQEERFPRNARGEPGGRPTAGRRNVGPGSR